MAAIQQPLTAPVNRRLHPQNEIRARNKAAWEKLPELTKDSTLTVEKPLEMKNIDRALEAAIEERAQVGAQ